MLAGGFPAIEVNGIGNVTPCHWNPLEQSLFLGSEPRTECNLDLSEVRADLPVPRPIQHADNRYPITDSALVLRN